ncbi:MAG: GTPase Era [Deltaproteobacteria bacterium]|nr:GTPase Era [Deltaproteobacteria bacterium]
MTRAQEPAGGPSRAGKVALIGRTNVGKSTLLNAALGLPLAIVSSQPQTTRHRLLGLVHHGRAQIALLDTPGLHPALRDGRRGPRTVLGRAMTEQARSALSEADVVVFVCALPRRPDGELRPHPGDVELLRQVPEKTPVVLAINKIDLVRDKRALLPLLRAWTAAYPFAAVVPLSALRTDGVRLLLDEIAALLPEREHPYAEDELTDRPLRFFAAEYVREPILEATREEVPHAVAVTIDRLIEPAPPAALSVAATIHVERPGQKRILIGKGGELVKRIGTRARERLEALTGRRVHVQLWIRHSPGWRDRPTELALLGYGDTVPLAGAAPGGRHEGR